MFDQVWSTASPLLSTRARDFERLAKWMLENYPVYATQLRKVWLWDEWPSRWGQDCGIDLVAETKTGTLWAIQAKAYSPATAIRKVDIDSFLSESSRDGFSYRLLIATNDRLGANARRTILDQTIPVGLVLGSQLRRLELDWPSSIGDLRPRRPLPKRPLPHSEEAISDICKGFQSENRGQLIMACGTGKTLIGLWSAERLHAQRTLVLTPSLGLLSQTLREWSLNADSPFEYLAVCSDPSVDSDELIEHTADLGIPVTTEVEVILDFMRRDGRIVIFSTYQSSTSAC